MLGPGPFKLLICLLYIAETLNMFSVYMMKEQWVEIKNP